MNLFAKHQKKKTEETFIHEPGRFTLPDKPGPFDKVADVFERSKVRIARKLTASTERLGIRTKKLMLIGFGLAVSAMSLSLMLSPFSKHLLRQPGKVPIEKHGAWVLPPGGASAISQEDFDKMIAFKHILDSLRVNDPTTYQELITGRQGLADSIDYLIRYHGER